LLAAQEAETSRLDNLVLWLIGLGSDTVKIFKVFVLAILLGCAGSARATVWNVGDLTTYVQASWGGDPIGSQPFTDPDPGAVLLVAQFNTVYGATFGVTVGSFSGFTMSFTSATTALGYIPSIGPFAPLDGNVLDPISTASGGFGGETLGLEFNVDFSGAGLLPGTSGLRFGDLILANLTGAQAPLNGLTVRQFLGDANILLSGGTSVITIADLGTLVGDVNGSFFNGTPDQFAQDHLVAPEISSETPLPAAFPLFASGFGAFGLLGRRRKRKNALTA
jgi:hypothetical protein